jgi:hypothetical protein
MKSAVKVAQELGLTVNGFSRAPDGTVTVFTGNEPVATKPNPESPLASWDDVFNDADKA